MMNISLKEKIDVVIPCHEKDLDTLPLCLQSINDMIEDNISQIFVIASENDFIKEICKKFDCHFFNETKYMGFSPSDLNEVNEKQRGWVFQQLIKLKGNPGKCENYLVIDADVMFIKPYRFLNENLTPNFIVCPFPTHESYIKMNYRLIGKYKNTTINYITDKMLFNVDIIKEIHSMIEKVTNEKNWIQGILKNIDNSDVFVFSEFELYGTYYGDKPHTEAFKLENHFPKKYLDTYDKCRYKFRKYDSITFVCN